MSYVAPNPLPYSSSAWSDIAAAGQQRVRFPLPQECATQLAGYAFDQSFQMAASSFGAGPKPKNTTAANFSSDLSDPNAILTSYSQPNHIGGKLVGFDAAFNIVPATWSDFKVMPFTFPGFLNTATGQPRRDPVTENVPCRIQYDYFVLDPAGVISTCTDGHPAPATSILDSGGTTAPTCVYKLGDIPIIPKSFFYCYLPGGGTDTTQRTNSLVQSGGITSGSTTYLATVPSPTNYKSWVSAALSSKWSSAVWDGTTDGAGSPPFGQIVAEDSRIEPYAGNIVARLTIYVLAK